MCDKTDANPYMLIVLLHMKSLTAKYIYFNKSEEYICLNRDTRFISFTFILIVLIGMILNKSPPNFSLYVLGFVIPYPCQCCQLNPYIKQLAIHIIISC